MFTNSNADDENEDDDDEEDPFAADDGSTDEFDPDEEEWVCLTSFKHKFLIRGILYIIRLKYIEKKTNIAQILRQSQCRRTSILWPHVHGL